jgi:hypothetical protein
MVNSITDRREVEKRFWRYHALAEGFRREHFAFHEKVAQARNRVAPVTVFTSM